MLFNLLMSLNKKGTTSGKTMWATGEAHIVNTIIPHMSASFFS